MSQPSSFSVRSTDFAFSSALLEASDDVPPRPGDVVDLEFSYIEPGEGPKPPESGAALVVSVSPQSIVLRIKEGESFRDGGAEVSVSGGSSLQISESPWIDAIESDQQGRPDPEGVAFSDDALPPGFFGEIRASVQRLAEVEPVDYHPGSGTRVRDLVHPSLYPYIEGRSKVSAPLPGATVDTRDRFGRPFEGSRYQWLPTPFKIDDAGGVVIDGYINNLDRARHGVLYEHLATLFSSVLPLIEAVLGYVDATRFFVDGDDDESSLPDPSETAPTRVAPRSVRGRELQVIPKIVEYRLGAGEVHEGVWHVEGMSHEHIVATCVVVLERDECLQGGSLSFKRAYTPEEAGHLFWHINQCRPAPVERLVEQATVPLGTVGTPAGRVLVFPNSHIHKLNALTVAQGADEGRRRVVVFWVVDPDVRIPSTREVPPQQGVLPREEALSVRLELMKERSLHKSSFNPRVVSLCEH